MAAEDDSSNFFSRWSRRKVQVRSGEPLPPEPPAPPVAPVAAAAAVVAPPMPELVTAPAETPAEPPPALTLDDVARLTPESDYSAFVARDVPADVRNAAVKKLFTDPHYNVMDGLDIYIDDYSQPSPITAAEMAKMVGAQFLKLVDDPNEPKPAAATATPATDTPPDTTAAEQAEANDAVDDAPVAADPREPTAAAHDAAPHDDHADLQLQPDDVPEPPGSGRRAG
ncbi:MAG: DUF3306 domain-containing protein [Hydrogenophaga sp.]|uniref:DUF3306 domain-containing protein n=1 Tax=unclassified Hydrogenophaga TaxID=2610897 RepID=UPI0036D4155E